MLTIRDYKVGTLLVKILYIEGDMAFGIMRLSPLWKTSSWCAKTGKNLDGYSTADISFEPRSWDTGRHYRCFNGLNAKVYNAFGAYRRIHGAVLTPDGWDSMQWHEDGSAMGSEKGFNLTVEVL